MSCSCPQANPHAAFIPGSCSLPRTEGTSHLGKHIPSPCTHPAVAPGPGCPSSLKGLPFWALDKRLTALGYQCPSWNGKVTPREALGVTWRLLQKLIPSVTGVPSGISH